MKQGNFKIFSLLFLASPLLSFPLIIYYIYKQKEYAYTFLALFLGLFAILYAPTHDLFRHTLFYYDCIGSPTDFIGVKQDILLYLLSSWFANWNINFEIIRFLFVFLSYQMYFQIFLSLQKRNKHIKENKDLCFLLFLLLFFSIRYFVICCGLRQGMATAFAIFGAYKLLVEDKKSAYVFLVLAPLTHISLVLAAIGIWIIKVGFIRLGFKTGVILSIFFYVLSMTLLNYLSSVLGGNVGKALALYTTGYWGAGGEAEEQISFKGLLASSFNQIQMVPLLYYMFRVRIKSKFFSFAMFCLILCGITLPYFAVIDRMIMLFLSVSIFLYLHNYDGSKWCIRIAKIELLFVALFFSVSFYAERATLRLSREYKLIAPVPYILANKYDEHWLWQNYDNWGK